MCICTVTFVWGDLWRTSAYVFCPSLMWHLCRGHTPSPAHWTPASRVTWPFTLPSPCPGFCWNQAELYWRNHPDRCDKLHLRPNISVEWVPVRKGRDAWGVSILGGMLPYGWVQDVWPWTQEGILDPASTKSSPCDHLGLSPFLDDPPLCSPPGRMGQQYLLILLTRMTTVMMMMMKMMMMMTSGIHL